MALFDGNLVADAMKQMTTMMGPEGQAQLFGFKAMFAQNVENVSNVGISALEQSYVYTSKAVKDGDMTEDQRNFVNALRQESAQIGVDFKRDFFKVR